MFQTGVQRLTGFLLTLALSARYDILDNGVQFVCCWRPWRVRSPQHAVHTLRFGIHRLFFRRHRLVAGLAAHRCAYAGLLLLDVALAGVQ